MFVVSDNELLKFGVAGQVTSVLDNAGDSISGFFGCKAKPYCQPSESRWH